MSREFELMEANEKLRSMQAAMDAEKDPPKRLEMSYGVADQQSKVLSMQMQQPSTATSYTSEPHTAKTSETTTARRVGGIFVDKASQTQSTTVEVEYRQGTDGKLHAVDPAAEQAKRQQPVRYAQEEASAPEPTREQQTSDALLFDGMPARGISAEQYASTQATAEGKTWSAPAVEQANGIGAGQQQERERQLAVEPQSRAIAPGEHVTGQVTKSFMHEGARFYALDTEKGERVVVPAGNTSRERGDVVEAARDEANHYSLDSRAIERDTAMLQRQQEAQQRAQQGRSM